jgi:DNA-binding MarR family transcriptional regulator
MKLQDLYVDPGHLIRRAYQISVAIFLEECRSFDLRLVDCAVLYGIHAMPETDQIGLSRAVAIDRSSIARVVDKLVERGLVARRVSEHDRRVNRLSLTAEGCRIVDSIQPVIDEVNQRILEPLNAEERQQFIHCLAKICEINNEKSRAPLYAVDEVAAGAGRKRKAG